MKTFYNTVTCVECGSRRLKNVTLKYLLDFPDKVYECLHCGCEFIKENTKNGMEKSIIAWTSGKVFQR
jgi:DNA-directed RNA polymerase subunit RPC12/RpoP